MTTPDKEEMPTEDRTAGDFWAEKRDGRWQLQMRHRGPGSSFCVAQINHWADNSEALTTRIANACNAYEPMRAALILAEKADRIHSKCQECEDGAQAPEACGDCFPSADDARVARRNVLKSLGVRMRDVDRARAIKAEPSICNCSQEDVHDYGPCGEDCRSLVVSTLPVNDRQTSDDVGILRALLEEELVWHEERDKSLSKQPQSNQTVWRRAEHQERIDVIRAALKGPASEAGKLSSAANDVLAERERQIAVEGFTAEHDRQTYLTNEMARAAACYAVGSDALVKEEGDDWYKLTRTEVWPWDAEWWKPGTSRQNLVKAGALILAEIERLDRAEAKLSTDEVL